MKAITQWVKNLVFIILFTTLLEMFLPENNMRKYVRVIMGFFIVTIFISPLAVIFNQDLSTMYRIIPGRIINDNWQEIKAKGEKIDEINQNTLRKYYGDRIAQRVKEIVDLDYLDFEKEIRVDVNEDYQITLINIRLISNRIKGIVIKPVKLDEGEKMEEIEKEMELGINSLKYKISQIFQVPANLIKIRLENGGE